MKQGFIKSAPQFFRLIRLSGGLFAVLLLLLAALIPAPLQEAADPALTPNPIRSAWFLLWIQELVSYSNLMIYPLLMVGVLFVLLPWLGRSAFVPKAAWFPRHQLCVNGISVVLFLAVIMLTVIAMFFRGSNWAFVLPF